MRSHTTSTMSHSFFTHGLPGIDVHHAELQRMNDHAVRSGTPFLPRLRQAVASVFISAGTRLAGDARSLASDARHQPA